MFRVCVFSLGDDSQCNRNKCISCPSIRPSLSLSECCKVLGLDWVVWNRAWVGQGRSGLGSLESVQQVEWERRCRRVRASWHAMVVLRGGKQWTRRRQRTWHLHPELILVCLCVCSAAERDPATRGGAQKRRRQGAETDRGEGGRQLPQQREYATRAGAGRGGARGEVGRGEAGGMRRGGAGGP